jgi:amidase
MNASELLHLSALSQAELLRKREISSAELTRMYLERIAKLDPQLNAFVTVHEKAAMKAAAAADVALGRGDSTAPFLGVPTAIKDLHPTRESWTHFGSRATAIPPFRDCITAKSLRQAGFIFLGKTASSEYGALPVTEPDGRAPSRNPWNTAVTPGGSSGGAGAAVAAGLIPVAHGSDGGGSIRIPSALCHLFGFKASRWLLPNAYGKSDLNVLYTCGPLARSVADAAAMLDAMLASTEQMNLRLPRPSLHAALAQAPAKQLRIRMVLNNAVATPSADLINATRNIAKVLESLGHHVEEASPMNATLEEFIPIWGRVVGEMPAMLPWRMQAATKWVRNEGKKVSEVAVRATAERLMKLVLQAMNDVDILLTPTVATRALDVGALAGLSGKDAFYKAAALGAFTAPFNLTGQPAASIPAGLTEDGLPLGVQLAAAHGQDAKLFQLCKQLEEALPWASRASAFFDM